MIARHYLDHGHAIAAVLARQLLHETPQARRTLDPGLSLSLALCWMRAGIPARADLALYEIKGNRPTIRVGDKVFAAPADETKAMEWLAMHTTGGAQLHAGALAAWTFHGGNPSRSAASTGGSPLLTSPRWQQPLSIATGTDTSLSSMRRQLMEPGEIDLPSETPLAVGDTAPLRHAALGGRREPADRQTRVGIPDARVRAAIQPATDGGKSLHRRRGDGATGKARHAAYHQQRWSPGICGRRARQSAADLPRNVHTVGPWWNTAQWAWFHNLLRAREINTQGKLVWEVGETGEDEPDLAGVFFGRAVAARRPAVCRR